MGVVKSPLKDDDRKRLDSIVQKMIDNQEPESNIQFVVDDFKEKYGQKKSLVASDLSYQRSKTTSLPANLKGFLMGGETGLTPLPELPEGQRKMIDERKSLEEKINNPSLEFDESDPVSSLKTAILSKTQKPTIRPVHSESVIKKPIGIPEEKPLPQEGIAPSEATKQLKKAENIFRENTDASVDHLQKVTGLSRQDLYNDANAEHVAQSLRPGNETDRIALDRLNESKSAIKSIAEGGDLEDMAARFRASQEPDFADQLNKLQSTGKYKSQDIGQTIDGVQPEEVKAKASLVLGNSTMGYTLFNFLSNSAVQQEVQRHPELQQEFKAKVTGLLNQYPEFGKTYLGNAISKKMEEMDMSNGVLNVVTKKELDQVVNKMVEDGQLNEQELSFINREIRPKMGIENLGRAIIGRPAVKTTGALENAAEGGLQGLRNLGQGVAEITQLRPLIQGERAALSTDIERENARTMVKPSTLWHEITQNGGQFLGQSLAVGGPAKGLQALNVVKSPAAALAISGGLQAYGNYAPEARKMFPDSKAKQIGFSLVMSGIEAATENIFKDTKVLDGIKKEMKPLVSETIEKFTNKEISTAAARQEIGNAFVKSAGTFAKGFGKATKENVAEEVIAQVGQDITEGVFEGKPVSEWVNGENLINTARQALLGSGFIGVLSARADMRANKGITAKQIYLMTKEPEYWADQIRQSESQQSPEEANDTKDKLSNLEYVSNLVKELDKNPDMTEKQKSKYLLTALESKINNEKPVVDETIANFQKQPYDKLKEDLLTGKDDGSFKGDESDNVNPEETKLFEEIEKVAPEGYKNTLDAAKSEGNILGGLDYMKEKAAENPVKFREEFGDELTDKILKQTPTEVLQEKLDYLIENNADDPALPVLDKLISERNKPRVRVTAEQMQAAQPEQQVNEPETILPTTEEPAKVDEQIPTTEEIRQPETSTEESTREQEKVRVPAEQFQSIAERGKNLATKIRGLKTRKDKLQANIFGVPMAIYDGALEVVATAVENGAKLADAISQGLESMRGKGFKVDEESFIKHIEDFEKGETPRVKVGVGEQDVEETGIKNETVNQERAERGLDEVDKATSRGWDDVVLKEARKKMKANPDYAKTLAKKLSEKPRPTTDTENAILALSRAELHNEHAKVANALDEAYNEDSQSEIEELKDRLEEIEQAMNNNDMAATLTGSIWGQAGAARKLMIKQDYSRAAIIQKARRANQGENITDETREALDELTKELEDVNLLVEELENERLRLSEENAIKDQLLDKKEVRKEKSEKLKKDRSAIIDKIKQKWNKKDGGDQTLMVTLPGAKQAGDFAKKLAAIAPELWQLVRNYVSSGINTAEGLVDAIHDDLKNIFPGIEKKDVRNGIANMQKNKPELKETYTKEELDTLIKREEVKQKIDYIITKIELSKQPAIKKWSNVGKDILFNVDRALQSTLDFSSVLRQGVAYTVKNVFDVVGVVANLSKGDVKGALSSATSIRKLAKPLKEMFHQTFSTKQQQRWLAELKLSPDWHLINNSKLRIVDTEDQSGAMKAKQEEFRTNILHKIPVLNKILGGAERAYVAYLNQIRVDRFRDAVRNLKDQDITPQNSPNTYRKLSNAINNLTGYGSLGKLEQGSEVLATAFFSPRLIAARWNTMFNPLFYASLPRSVQKVVAGDMLKFAVNSMAILILMNAMSDDDDEGVEWDIRSTDFLKYKKGDTRYDILGGYQQYLRMIGQVVSGQEKKGDQIIPLGAGKNFAKTGGDVFANFFAGKLSPTPSLAWDYFMRHKDIKWWNMDEDRNTMKETYLAEKFIPMTVTQGMESWDDEGAKTMLTQIAPAMLGVGVNTYESPPPPETFTIYGPGNKTRQATQQEFEKFQEMRDNKKETKLEEVKRKGVGLNKYGELTLDKDEIKKRKPYSQLDEKEIKEVEQRVSAQASAEAKKTFQPKKPKF